MNSLWTYNPANRDDIGDDVSLFFYLNFKLKC